LKDRFGSDSLLESLPILFRSITTIKTRGYQLMTYPKQALIFKILSITTLSITLSSFVLIVEASPKDYNIGVKTGTLGIGLELSKPIKKSLDLRLGINYIEAQVSNFKIGSVKYDVKSSATSINALLDWYPKQNKQLYLSGGFLLGHDNIKPKPSPNFIYHGIRIGRLLNRYKFDLKVDYKDIAPYFSIGYGNKHKKKKGWVYAADLGFAYLGKPKTSFNIIDKTTGNTPTQIPQSEIEKELVKINKKLKDYTVWPVLSLTWSYQF